MCARFYKAQSAAFLPPSYSLSHTRRSSRPLPNMSLHYLPEELLYAVLQMVDSPRDLIAAATASSRCWAAYSRAPSLLLTSVLKNAIHPVAMPHALAALHAPRGKPDARQADMLEAFVNRYHADAGSFTFPTDLLGLQSLCRLYNLTSFFIHDYASRAMQVLLSNTAQEEKSLSLSQAELARFQRAFFRHNVYCLAFPAEWDRDARFSAESQFTRFLSLLVPWEVEEMSCVHMYYISIVDKVFGDVDDQLVAAVLSAPGAVAHTTVSGSPNGSGPSLNDVAADSVMASDGPGMVGFEDLEQTDLMAFSKDTRYQALETYSFIASMDPLHIYKLVNGQTGILRSVCVPMREFLPQAIEEADMNNVADTMILEPHYEDSPVSAGPGYYSFKRCKQDHYLGINHALEYSALREREFVFWGHERISCPKVARSLGEAKDMDTITLLQQYDVSNRPSAEDRLEGIRLPHDQMENIVRNFGFTQDGQGDIKTGRDILRFWENIM